MAAAYIATRGTVGSGYGVGDESLAIGSDWGLSRKIRDLQALLFTALPSGLAASDLALTLLPNTNTAVQKSGTALCKLLFRDLFNGLKQVCYQAGISGVTDVDSFSAYNNTGAGGPYAALMAPEFLTLYNIVYGKNPSATNVYAPAVSSIGTVVVVASTPGSPGSLNPIDTSTYAGAAVANVVVTGFAGTTAIITVTGQARTSSGTLVSSRTWTVSVTGNGTFTLVPTIAGDLVTSVTSMAVAAGITAGTFAIGCAVPAGRTDPPT